MLSETDYIAAIKEHLQAAGKYYDDLLPIQATNRDFLKGFYALCHAGSVKQKSVEEIASIASMTVEDYRRLGREAGLIVLEESVRITLTGTLLKDYRSDVFTLERTASPHALSKAGNPCGCGKPKSKYSQRCDECVQREMEECKAQAAAEKSLGTESSVQACQGNLCRNHHRNGPL